MEHLLVHAMGCHGEWQLLLMIVIEWFPFLNPLIGKLKWQTKTPSSNWPGSTSATPKIAHTPNGYVGTKQSRD